MNVVLIVIGVLIIVLIIESSKKAKLPKSLLNAVRERNKEKVEELITKGADVNYVLKKTPLQVAVENSDKEMVSLLIAKGANVNFDQYGKSVLQIAVEKHDKEMASFLLQEGAKVDSDRNKYILDSAVKNQDKEIVSLLVDKGAYVSSDFIKTAIVSHDKETVLLLIEKCKNLNSIYDGKTILDLAEDNEIIDVLKKHGAKTKAELDKENAEKARRIAEEAELQYILNENLLTAIAKHMKALVESYILEGADVNYVDKDGFTPLIFAIYGYKSDIDMEIINLLLRNGADPWKRVQIQGDSINAIAVARYGIENEALANFLEYS